MFVVLGWEGGTLGDKNQETNSQIAPLTLKLESKGGGGAKIKTFNISILEKLNFHRMVIVPHTVNAAYP